MARVGKGFLMILFTLFVCYIIMLGVDFAADQGVLDIIVSWFR